MSLPVKVLHEYLTCFVEVPVRCRKRAAFWMDGLGFCLAHEKRIHSSLERFKYRIEYRVGR